MADALIFAGFRLPASGIGTVVSVRPRVVAFAAAAAAAAGWGARSPYEVLRVRETATATAREIKAAYRSMAKRFHPDVTAGRGGGEHDFVEIHQAYEELSDPAARARYDISIGKGRRIEVAGFGEAAPLRLSRWETDQCW